MEEQKATLATLLSILPMATLIAFVFSIATGIVCVVDPDTLSFQAYMTQVVAVWGFVAVGRGLAVNKGDSERSSAVSFLNQFPWALAVTVVVGIVGYIEVLANTDGSLDFDEYGKRMAFLIGALGVGRGIGTFKKDAVLSDTMEPVDEAVDLEEDDEGIEEEPPLEDESLIIKPEKE